MKIVTKVIILGLSLYIPSLSFALDVNITADLTSVDVIHKGKKITIMRKQNQDNLINPAYAKTSRQCPPFCIQPIKLAAGVETIGELEILHYLKKISDGDTLAMVVDSRSAGSVESGSIPGSINIPAYQLDSSKSNFASVRKIMEQQFGASYRKGAWNFSSARTLVLFCNGPWCGQSTATIKTLLELGYPAQKLLWYRGGMQNWEALGLTTVKAESIGMGWAN